MGAAPVPLATAADLARLGPAVRAEVIGGVIVEKAAPSFEHADAQGGLIDEVSGRLFEVSGRLFEVSGRLLEVSESPGRCV